MSESKFVQFANEVTNQIIKELEKGNVVWKKPWKNLGRCKNLLTKSSYSGFNQIYLNWKMEERGFKTPYFMTFQQARSIGANVRKGAKSIQIVYWKSFSNANKDEEQVSNSVRLFPFVHFVFNIDEIEHIDSKYLPNNEELEETIYSIEKCDNLIHNFFNIPEIRHGGDRAYYTPSHDFIQMPFLNQFYKSENYYSTLFHEIIHSTGHKSRLDRFAENTLPTRFGSIEYSKEELVAEIGATFLNAHCGIKEHVFDTSIAYIQNWLKLLKSDPKMIITASSNAQRAFTYLTQNVEVEEFA